MKNKIMLFAFAACLLMAGCGSRDRQDGKETESAYQASDYIEIGPYRNLSLKEEEIEVPDAEIDAEISDILDQYQEAEEITDRGIQNGDVVNISSRGYIDGKEVDTLKALNFDLIIGEGSFGEDYEAQLIDVRTGETKEFDLSYPKDYDSTNLAGKTVHFVVKVNMIVHYLEQDLTDEYVTDLTDAEYTTVESFRQGCADMLLEENRDRYMLNAVKKKILENSEIKGYPENALNQSIAEITEFYEDGAQDMNMDSSEYLNLINGKENIRQIAQDILKEEMMLKAIREKESITLTEEEYERYADSYLEENGMDMPVKELEEMFGRKELEEAFLLKKTGEFLLEQVTVE